MILGIGTDIVEIERIKKACEKEAFLSCVFTEKERAYAGPDTKKACWAASLAGDFAVKEAVVKALGTGFVGCAPRDVEVIRAESGAPEVVLYRGAKKHFQERRAKRLWVSMSHEKAFATAMAVLEGDEI